MKRTEPIREARNHVEGFNDNSGRAVSSRHRKAVFREERHGAKGEFVSEKSGLSPSPRQITLSGKKHDQKPGKETALIDPSLDLLQGFCARLRIGARGGATVWGW